RAAAVLAADQAAAAVHGVPVRVHAGLAEDAYGPGGLVPAQGPVVGDIAEDQVAAGREPGRALRPPAAGMQPLQPGVAVKEGETLIEYLEPGPDRVAHTGSLSRDRPKSLKEARAAVSDRDGGVRSRGERRPRGAPRTANRE